MTQTDYYQRKTCRLCENPELILAVAIPSTPPCDAYITKEKLNIPQKEYGLDIYQCAVCGHFQLIDVVSPEILFSSDYSYFSGRTSIVKHFEEYANKVIKLNDLKIGSRIVDIGSNDGTFLHFFQERGMKVLGVDPAKGVVDYANNQGIHTIHSLFDDSVATNINKQYGHADVVTANNVFAHADDLIGIARNIRSILSSEGIFVFEVSYFPDVVKDILLGTIFHEHLSYHTVKPLISFLERAGLELIDVEYVKIQGGSIICTAQVIGGNRKKSSIIDEFVKSEEDLGYYKPSPLKEFSGRLELLKSISSILNELKESGKTFAGFGASRGGTLLTYLLQLNKYMDFIFDDNPDKQGKFSPGHHLPVLPTTLLYEKMPNYLFILAWIHSKNIINSHKDYLEKGGKFVTFFPKLKIIDKNNLEI